MQSLQQLFVWSGLSYLNNVVNFGLDEVEQGRDTPFGRLLNFDGTSANGSNGLSHKVDVDFGSIPTRVKESVL